jgi:predicted DsbA family dithiol-disulfide isomerase
MPSKLVKVTVVSDLICPYCYIGQKELNSAVAEVKQQNPNLSVEIEYRPFFLHPYVKDDEPIEKIPWFISKFGKENTELMLQRVSARGKECGIDFKQGGLICSTFRAHKLLYKAWNIGGQTTQQALLDGLFKANFYDKIDISNKNILAAIGEKAGVLSKQEIVDYLSSDEDVQVINDMAEQSREAGVTGVPVTVIDGKWLIRGGQSKEVYQQIFKKMAKCCGEGDSVCDKAAPAIPTDANAVCGFNADNQKCVAT